MSKILSHCPAVLKSAMLAYLIITSFGIAVALADGSNDTDQVKALDLEGMNLSVKPGDDFFEYANGIWIEKNPVPPDKSCYGASSIVHDKTYDQVREIIEDAANNTTAPEGSLEQKIGEFYRVGMDNETLERQRLEPIMGDLERIENMTNASDIQEVSNRLMDIGIMPLFALYAAPDKKNSKIMIATISQGGRGLPDRDFYFREDNESVKTREDYVAYMTNVFVLLGDSPDISEKNAKAVMRMETRLANASFNNVDDSDEVKTYNKMSMAELCAYAPGVDWHRLFEYIGRPDVKEVNVRNPSYFKELGKAMQEESVDDWKAFYRVRLVTATAYYLSSDFQNELFDFYYRKLGGQEEMKPRWKRVLDAEHSILGEPIGQLYVKKHFDSGSKSRMQEMVVNLKKALSQRIQNLTWMEPKTKEKALEKLEVLDVQVGYPDELQDLSGLEVKNDSYCSNLLRSSAFRFHYGRHGMDKIGKPVNRNIWEMNPDEINAYADYNKNLMVFPAGILQPPFFNPDADDAVNYGAIGAVIGHEMSHNFDSQGRKFDSEGNMTDWWTTNDSENFNKSTSVLVDEYNRFEVLPGLYVNGNLTLPENIADFAGITMAYQAYKISQSSEPELIDNLTGDQRFFISYAQAYRESCREEALRTLALTDSHSPDEFRVNGVVFNVPEFYSAFPEVKPGDKLYRPESERPGIW